MPTIKTRTNLSLSSELDKVLTYLADRDNMPKAGKAVQLIEMAIEMQEDQAWDALAKARDKKNAKFISHKDAWG